MIVRAAVVFVAVGLLTSLATLRTLAAEPTQIVAGARIAASAADAVRMALADPSRALVPALSIGDQVLPAGALAIAPGTVALTPTFASVPLALFVDGRVVRTMYAGYRLTTYVRTAVAARDIPSGTVLSPADITLARIASSGRAAVEADALIGRRLRDGCAKGLPIEPEATSIVQIVHAGLPALLIVHDGPVALAADVVARSSGGVGESVTVYNPQTQRALSAVVTAPDTVELTLPGSQ